ncbi:MAG: hypothetical protein KGI50_00535 [Patescibacteria group bacterium]|nr:hypothetical protein [Patescibacteria group bacterium]MDE2438157.1 hypothetical protein [Patescibacteria group bacterium]
MWFLSDTGALERMDARVGILREIDRAMHGLRDLGLHNEFCAQHMYLVHHTGSPSDRLSQALSQLSCSGDECIEASVMRNALRETSMLI